MALNTNIRKYVERRIFNSYENIPMISKNDPDDLGIRLNGNSEIGEKI